MLAGVSGGPYIYEGRRSYSLIGYITHGTADEDDSDTSIVTERTDRPGRIDIGKAITVSASEH